MSLPPLVPPGGALDAAERTRYARHLLLPEVGDEGQRRLRNARVLVVGAGGLGSPALLYLAAAGVGTLGVVDADRVDTTNLQRQIVHRADAVGSHKVTSAASTVAAIAPGVEVIEHEAMLTAENILEVLADYDVVLDGADNFPTRYLVGDACARLGLPHVWGSVHRFEGQISVWYAGVGPCYRCVFPEMPPEGSVPSCGTAGVLGAVCGAIGSVLGAEALKLVLGIGEPLVGRLLLHDALAQTWSTLPVRARPDCPVCGPDADPLRSLGVALASSGGGALLAPEGLGEVLPTITPERLAALLAEDPETLLVDVREPGERAIVAIPGATAMPLASVLAGGWEPPQGRPVHLVCKSGGRSAQAVRALRDRGFDAVNVEGGVLGWVREVDPSLPTY